MSQVFSPRPYQSIAADFLLEHQRCNLFAEPGLGKTSTVYMVLDILKLAGSGFFPALVIAPKKVIELPWPDEQKKWDRFKDMRVVSLLGERDVRELALAAMGDLYLINYDNAQWLVKHLGARWPFKIVIADESTALKSFRLKGGGARAKALSMIAERTGRWINLSGTPAPNGLKDLWGQQWFIDQGARLGSSYTAFMRRWFYENPYARTVEPRAGAEAQIHAAIADVTLALRAKDWFDIREPVPFRREVELPPEARVLYDRMERDFFLEIEGNEVSAANAAVLSSKLLQMASGSVYDVDKNVCQVHDAKIEALRSLINELGGESLLVAYWFKFEAEMLKKAFPDLRIFSGAKDQDDWNKGKIPLMAIHPASAGHGLSLHHGGRVLVNFTHTWNLELRMQCAERIGPARQLQAGYDRAVMHYDIVARNTLDEVVLERLTSKRSIQEALMEARAHRG